ncbi:copB, Cu2+-exporting ATPase (plasmid) [Nostoc flagelliforme CCNUN1]|uniref:CopB, Cu2+-exporting ATPase n=1 Tax=Nostoc flagelliforme CCNUN1 TaxID=2038116 RepID=A0A2K8T6C3_9NOSO|nr:heavy metal translocating P-type ATPase [Nostoc flagelliforme]AUB43256.1 copB, Cu2+-exporting ATPase [Nostoc flagelliforme CCNUN1]
MVSRTQDTVSSIYEEVDKLGYKVIHSNERRLRIYLPRLAVDTEYAKTLKQVMESFDFVTDVRINPAAKSIAIEHDNQGVSSTLIQEKILSYIEQVSIAETLQNQNFDFLLDAQTDIAFIKTVSFVAYEVVHKNERRIRVLIPRLGDDVEYARKLKYLVESINEVVDVRINARVSCIVVEFDYELDKQEVIQAQEQVFAAIEEAPNIQVDEFAIQKAASKLENNHDIDYVQRLGPSVVSLVLSFGALIGLPFPGVLVAGSIFFAAIPVFQRTWEYIQEEKQLNIDFLDSLTISLHTAIGNYFAPAFMLGLIEGSEIIRDMTARSTERTSLDLLDCLGKYAFVERDGQEVKIAVRDVVEGDRVIVYPGDQIPVDGHILRGTGLIDQCKLTGESVPVTRSEGEEVFASTLLVNGSLCILVERTGNNTRAGVIVALMQSAPVHDTRVENYAAIIANQAVVPTLVVGTTVGLLTGDLNRAIALLTLDIGTGIRVSVPTTILSALTYAARNGVFIRSGRAIEILSRVDTIVFDKTGTLTQGHARITTIKLTEAGVSERQVLALAATAEQGLTHPVAEAIVRHAKDEGVELDECTDWDYHVGLGVFAVINSQQILVGSHRLMAQENVSLDYLNEYYPNLKSGSNSLVYVAANGKLLGVILYSDPPRQESKDVIQEIKQQGISPYMLSGDVTRVARAIAEELGIDDEKVYAEAFPERKVEVVRALHDTGKVVAFCGDGINDSAALAYADVSISFAGATDIARETADIVLMEDDLRGLTHAIKIARHAMDIIWQNAFIVGIPNISAAISGVLFALDPVLAIIINNGSAILAEINGLRPLLGPGDVTPLSSSLDITELLKEEKLHTHKSGSDQQNEITNLFNGRVAETTQAS